MPSILPRTMTEPPQRKIFETLSPTKHNARQFKFNKATGNEFKKPKSTSWSLPTLESSFYLRHLSLSENSKFLICCFMWYFASSLSSNMGKQIMNVFKYPVTLTFVQFILVSCYSALTQRITKQSNIKRPSKRIIQTIIPLSLFMTVGHIFSSISISRIPVSLVHTIKALAPLFTVLFYRFIFKVTYSSKVYAALIPLTLGVILACSFTLSNNIIGLVCALVSCLIFVLQNIFNKKLLYKDSTMGESNPNKLDKMNMMFYSSFIAFVLMIPLWFYSDGYRIMTGNYTSAVSARQLVSYFLLNGTTHFAQSWFAFTTLSMSSPVTYSIASLVKRIFVIVMSIVWFGQQVKATQSVGIALTFVGLWMYQKAKREVDQNETKACENSLEVLPTSNNSKDHGVMNEGISEKVLEMNITHPTISVKKWIGNRLPDSNAARQTKLL